MRLTGERVSVLYLMAHLPPPSALPRPYQHSVGSAREDSLISLPSGSRSQSTQGRDLMREKDSALVTDVWATHFLFTSCTGWWHILKSLLDFMLKTPPSQEWVTQRQLTRTQEIWVYFNTDLLLSDEISGMTGSVGHTPGWRVR